MQSSVHLLVNDSLMIPSRADEKSKCLAHRKRPFAFKCPNQEKKQSLFISSQGQNHVSLKELQLKLAQKREPVGFLSEETSDLRMEPFPQNGPLG